ncbi:MULTISPECIES: hypothetical protein [unclassified Microbacterium]|nr:MULTISPECIES: hypothetical protein [unclassified Microbacterium]KRD54330.1 hypothetical protein ASE34_04505 [Microbacterium sp. Root280D1]
MSVQIDGYNTREAFTVSMIGYAEDIAPGSEARRLDGHAPQPSPSTDRRWVTFVPISIEGRIFAVDSDPSDREPSSEARQRGTVQEQQLLTP